VCFSRFLLFIFLVLKKLSPAHLSHCNHTVQFDGDSHRHSMSSRRPSDAVSATSSRRHAADFGGASEELSAIGSESHRAAELVARRFKNIF
jgi:hypothetical protein